MEDYSEEEDNRENKTERWGCIIKLWDILLNCVPTICALPLFIGLQVLKTTYLKLQMIQEDN